MNKKISDIMDCVEYYPLSVQEKKTRSAERIVNLTMKKITAEKAAVSSYVPRRTRKSLASVALAAVLVVALAGTAFAIYRFGLKDLAGPTRIGEEQVHTLSLNGLKGSPEYEAAQEWESYVNQWYKEGENITPPDLIPDAYSQYNAFSEEAKDTLDGILDKYNLKMHNAPTYVHSLDELYSALGINGFIPALGNNGEYPVSGTFYEDGTFSFNSAAAMPNSVDVRYQFYRFTKGTLTRTGFLIANADDFEEWVYTTERGIEVVLAISGNKSIMAVNLDNSFVFVNVLSGTENNDSSRTSFGASPIEKCDLEAFADSFDLVALNGVTK
ncbi:MAG: hypothetical protein LBN43_08250 [Oscillospiraceae bacterium]|jgi:hypothetical protein|nr:hypothetical protein [Oscillospiraceae bacterium]